MGEDGTRNSFVTVLHFTNEQGRANTVRLSRSRLSPYDGHVSHECQIISLLFVLLAVTDSSGL